MFDILKIFGDICNGAIELVAMAFKEGWLYYIIGGLIVLVIAIAFFS